MAAVELEIQDDVATVRLNRPEAYNAIDDVLAGELSDAMGSLWRNDDVRAVILTGNGEAFCGGGDLRRLREMGDDEGIGDPVYEVAGKFHESITAIRQMSKAVIAAVNGPAAGGGFSLALACDYRIMSNGTFMQLAYTSHGLSIDGGGTFTLPRIVGWGRASAIALLDERIPADEAVGLGLVHESVHPDELLTRAAALAERFAGMPVEILGRTKRLFNASYHATLEDQLEAERNEIAAAGDHPEAREGISSFLEKRPANYRH